VDVRIVARPSAGEPARFKACYVVGWAETHADDVPWVDDSDSIPAATHTFANGEAWSWLTHATLPDGPFRGNEAHTSSLVHGALHQHGFEGWQTPPLVAPDDVLFAMVWLDARHPPETVMLQWKVGDTDWEHRAFWGADRISWGMTGTVSRLPMGRLPFSAEWVRLEVSAAAVGLVDRRVTGMAFTLWGGRAYWDYAGVRRAECGRLRDSLAQLHRDIDSVRAQQWTPPSGPRPPGIDPARRAWEAARDRRIAELQAGIDRLQRRRSELDCG
jgi:hypothetical protein